jgi:hypothetical protein
LIKKRKIAWSDKKSEKSGQSLSFQTPGEFKSFGEYVEGPAIYGFQGISLNGKVTRH